MADARTARIRALREEIHAATNREDRDRALLQFTTEVADDVMDNYERRLRERQARVVMDVLSQPSRTGYESAPRPWWRLW